jgi:hypothetical protein
MNKQVDIELVTVQELDDYRTSPGAIDQDNLVRTIRAMFPLIEILADDHSPAGRSAKNILRLMEADGWTAEDLSD